jgi:Domain of unknown function (DUF1871)
MAIPEEYIQKTMQLLVNWNPLGDRANLIKDLDNYRTEAIDILFHMDSRGPSADPTIVIRDIINEAFDLSLSLDECSSVAKEIAKIKLSK